MTVNIKEKKHIVVEGPIGIGKTTLARRVAISLGGSLLLEQPDDNPFLERFYKNRQRYALPTQLSFLFQRVQQLKSIAQGDLFNLLQVADFMLDKDPLFARATLTSEEFVLYEHIYQHLAKDIPAPDLVIYLQASTDVLVERIRNRGVLFERNMDPKYLDNLVQSYTHYFLHYHHAPLLMVNSEHLNFLDNEEHYALLLTEIQQISSGRHYFNPLI